MKVHDALAKIRKKAAAKQISVLSGYVGYADTKRVRLFRSVSQNVYVDLATEAILHEEPVPGDDSGKRQIYVDAAAPVELGIETTAIKIKDGTWCSPRGTMYCWERIIDDDGTVYITMRPCGSCPPTERFGLTEALLGNEFVRE